MGKILISMLPMVNAKPPKPLPSAPGTRLATRPMGMAALPVIQASCLLGQGNAVVIEHRGEQLSAAHHP